MNIEQGIMNGELAALRYSTFNIRYSLFSDLYSQKNNEVRPM